MPQHGFHDVHRHSLAHMVTTSLRLPTHLSWLTRSTTFVLTITVALACFVPCDGSAATLTVAASQDTTIFQEAPGNSNGAGAVFITGRAGGTGNPAPLRRALLALDFSGLPQGTTVESATLTLTLTQSAGTSLVPFGFYRVLSSWGEAVSIAASLGQGVPAATGDAIWTARSFRAIPASAWATAGGDYAASLSATTLVGGMAATIPTPYTWLSTPQFVTDVQHWIDDPASNFGWILIGGEGGPITAWQFTSSENLTASIRAQHNSEAKQTGKRLSLRCFVLRRLSA